MKIIDFAIRSFEEFESIQRWNIYVMAMEFSNSRNFLKNDEGVNYLNQSLSTFGTFTEGDKQLLISKKITHGQT